MIEKLLLYLKYEEQLIDELVSIAEKQQIALIKYNLTELERLTAYQEETSKLLHQTEESRINLIATWLGLSKKEASSIWLSEIEQKVKTEELAELRQIKKSLSIKINKLSNLNSTNRLLANRARNNVNQIISVISDGNNHLCNVKV